MTIVRAPMRLIWGINSAASAMDGSKNDISSLHGVLGLNTCQYFLLLAASFAFAFKSESVSLCEGKMAEYLDTAVFTQAVRMGPS